MARGISVTTAKRRCYVLKCDRDLPKEEQTRFYYGILRAEKHADIQNKLVEVLGGDDNEKSRTQVHSGSQQIEVLLAGLVGVENYLDEEGRAILWPDGGGREKKLDFLTTLKRAWRQELAEAILEGQLFSETQAGESASPSGPA